MSTVRIEVLSRGEVVGVLEPDRDLVRIGRAPHNDLVIAGECAALEHAQLFVGSESVYLSDLGTPHGTTVVRGSERHFLDERATLRIESGDVVCFGSDATPQDVSLRLLLAADRDPDHVIEVRPLARLTAAEAPATPQLVRTLAEVQQRIASAEGLDEVLRAVADAALELVPRATHATLVLREDPIGSAQRIDAAFVPVLTRIRAPDGRGTTPDTPVRVSRSVFRKVIRERAAVMAADAPSEGLSSESLLGASIRSTVGVPLWKRDEIVGVIQVDNRDAPGMFESSDVAILGLLAVSASLAVAHARLIRRLSTAEEQLTLENRYLRGRERERRGAVSDILGESAAMTALMRQVDKVAVTRATVLIEGETGTGKELVAAAIHDRSKRRDRLFIAQNCAALPETLLESELFGHKRGAFTGATEEKKGLFEIADGGTLFLDEIGETPLILQAKLLRVLQDGEIRRVGSSQVRYVDVRIVAATNRDLEREVAGGRFREDLYYRLKVFPITVPPLRERCDDLPILARYFLSRYSKELGKPIAGFSQQCLESLSSYEWPGNVRELENEVHRLVIQADTGQFLTPDLLNPKIRKVEGMVNEASVVKGTLKEMMEQLERHLVTQALRDHDNNKTNAARALGITREGLHKKLRQLKLG